MEVKAVIRWGILGWGNIAKRFAKSLAFSKNGKLSAIASQTESKQNEFKKEHPDNGCTVYSNYEQLLLDGDIDAVYIALPHKWHMQFAITAIEHNKAVLCEKPIGMNVKQLDNIIESARAQQCFFMEALKTPFIPFTDVIRQDLDQGIIGTVKAIYANFCSDAGNRLSKQHYLFDSKQGGVLYDTGTYPVGFILNMIQSQVVDVKAKLNMSAGIDFSYRAELLFENGVIGKVEGAIDEAKPRQAVVLGDQGTMVIPVYNRAESYQVTYSDGRKVTKQLKIVGDDLLGEIEEVHRCLKLGLLESPKYSWKDSRDVLTIMDWIRDVGII